MKLDDLSPPPSLIDDWASSDPSTSPPRPRAGGIVVGRLLGLLDQGRSPLVSFDGQPMPGAMPARCSVDLRPAHIGQSVMIAFEDDDPQRPIVFGVVRGATGWPLPAVPGRVQVSADGERMTVAATSELVLRCGRAMLTLHADGRIVIRGEEILTDATGANRVRGGSVQLN